MKVDGKFWEVEAAAQTAFRKIMGNCEGAKDKLAALGRVEG